MCSPSTVPPAPRGTSATEPTASIRAAIAGVGRRHDLAAVAEVDLVAVVLRRVVARGDHHAGRAAELADREGQHGRRQRPRHHPDLEPGARHHLGGVAGEVVAAVPRVEADHHRAGRRPAPCRYAASPAAARMTTTRFIRFGPAPTAPRSPAVPNSRVPANRSARSAGVGAALDVGDDLLQLGPGGVVGVLGQPRREHAPAGRRWPLRSSCAHPRGSRRVLHDIDVESQPTSRSHQEPWRVEVHEDPPEAEPGAWRGCAGRFRSCRPWPPPLAASQRLGN